MIVIGKSVYPMQDGYVLCLFIISFQRCSATKVQCVYCSGGHFNPAVSLSAYLCGGMELLLLGPYVVAQMLGGMVGAGLSMVSKTVEAKLYQEKKKENYKVIHVKKKKKKKIHL